MIAAVNLGLGEAVHGDGGTCHGKIVPFVTKNTKERRYRMRCDKTGPLVVTSHDMDFYLAVLPARLHLLPVVSQDEAAPFTLGPLGTFQRQLKYLGFDLEVALMTKQDLRWTKDQAID